MRSDLTIIGILILFAAQLAVQAQTNLPLDTDEAISANPFLAKGKVQLASPQIEIDSILFEDRASVKLFLALEGATIHFTTGEGEPTIFSPHYTGVFSILETSLLQVRAFHPDFQPSEIVEVQLVKLTTDVIENVALVREAHAKYPGKGAEGLVDRKKGSTNFRTDEWLGFQGDTIELTVDLQRGAQVEEVFASFLQDHNSWIFLPSSIEVYGSKRGKRFELLQEIEIKPPSEAEAAKLHFERVKFPRQKLKQLKVRIVVLHSIPTWHPGSGTAAWLFMDEVIVQ